LRQHLEIFRWRWRRTATALSAGAAGRGATLRTRGREKRGGAGQQAEHEHKLSERETHESSRNTSAGAILRDLSEFCPPGWGSTLPRAHVPSHEAEQGVGIWRRQSQQ